MRHLFKADILNRITEQQKLLEDKMKFGKFLYGWLALSIAAAFFSTWIPGDLLILIVMINLSAALGLFMFLVYIRCDVFDDIKNLSIKNAARSIFYKPDFEKISKDMELIINVLDNRVIANPDKVHKYTIASLARNIYDDLLSLSKNNTRLPMEIRVKLYKFYRKEKALLIRTKKARKYYAPNLYIRECKKLTDRANEFTANLAKILESCRTSSNLHESIMWLKGHGELA